jgi:hypothetical protein
MKGKQSHATHACGTGVTEGSTESNSVQSNEIPTQDNDGNLRYSNQETTRTEMLKMGIVNKEMVEECRLLGCGAA